MYLLSEKIGVILTIEQYFKQYGKKIDLSRSANEKYSKHMRKSWVITLRFYCTHFVLLLNPWYQETEKEMNRLDFIQSMFFLCDFSFLAHDLRFALLKNDVFSSAGVLGMPFIMATVLMVFFSSNGAGRLVCLWTGSRLGVAAAAVGMLICRLTAMESPTRLADWGVVGVKEMVFLGASLGGVLAGERESSWFIGEVYSDRPAFIGPVSECPLWSVLCGIGLSLEETFPIPFINCTKESSLTPRKNLSATSSFAGIDTFTFFSSSILLSITFLRLRNSVAVV